MEKTPESFTPNESIMKTPNIAEDIAGMHIHESADDNTNENCHISLPSQELQGMYT